MSAILNVNNLSASFGSKRIFSNLNLELEEHTITVMCGPSGIGKSTLLHCLTLLTHCDVGTILVKGKVSMINGVVLDEKNIRDNVGIVFQDFYLWDNKTVLDNISEALVHVKGITKKDALICIIPIIEELSLDKSLLAQYPPELSRGQRQRVALARTLAMDTDIILMDEPTASLDRDLVIEIQEMIQKLAKKGKTFLIVTHDLDFARSVGDKIYNFEELIAP